MTELERAQAENVQLRLALQVLWEHRGRAWKGTGWASPECNWCGARGKDDDGGVVQHDQECPFAIIHIFPTAINGQEA